ncbi:MAG: hypothetical protein ACI9EW_004178 [Cellvibrionaceae bacterium]|jgi:hypothetical protein
MRISQIQHTIELEKIFMSETRTRYTKEFKLEPLQLWESSEKTATAIETDLGLAKG